MADSIYCSQCGTQLDAQARFCSKCGNVTASVAAPVPSQPGAMAAPAPSTATPPPQPMAMSAAASAMAAPPPQPMAMSAVPPAMPPQYGAIPQAYAQPPGYIATGALPYAGFWMRVGAYLLDLLILIIPLGILSLLPILGIVINIVGIWLYFALQESSERQATIGKRALNIYVTDLQGRRISFGQATGRHFGKIISGFILGIGYMMAGFTEKKQGLHDIMASTLVKRR